MAMIRPETEMKDSGIEWIGDIPSNWETIPLKKIVVDRAGGAWGNEPYENNSTICMRIADFDFDRGIFQDKSETELTKRSYKEYQIDKLLLQTNDICIEKSGGGEKTPVGRAVLFDKPYDALFANFMDRIRVDNAVSFPKYVEYYLRAMYFLLVTTLYIKQTTGIQNLNVASLLEKEVITLPSLSEQQAIAEYLDKTCSKIDEIIAEAKASIAEYKILKQSVIYETVTKGIDSSPVLVESGIEWVGLIPDTWSVIPNKYVMHKEKNLCEKWSGEDVMSLTMNGVIVRDLQNPTGKMPATFDGYQYIEDGDLLMCLFDIDVTPRCVGRVTHDGVTSPAYSNFKVHDNASRDYFYYYYLMVDNTKELLHLAKNLRHSFTEEQLGQLKVPMPPLSEQQAIADYLDDKVVELDSLIAEKESLINDLEAYKKSLIYEVVTGKRRVV